MVPMSNKPITSDNRNHSITTTTLHNGDKIKPAGLSLHTDNAQECRGKATSFEISYPAAQHNIEIPNSLHIPLKA